MERYEAYKDSGVEWLGEIPVGWEVKRFRYAFDLITDKVGDNLLKIGLENIESESGKFIATDTEFEGDGIHFLSGDILFGKLRPYLAKVYLADFRGKAVGDFFVFRSKGEIKDQFGAKLILSKRFIDITNSSTYGSKMPRVSWDFISELLIAYPNIEEQTTIANFLDGKTAEIDALIAQKERLLELYEEEKTAIINHAVTKGLDPNAELKDSDVEWLGEIPVGWNLKKLKYVTKHGLQNGIFKKATDFGSGIKLINVGDIYTHNFLIDENSLERVECTESEVAKYEVSTGDIFFVRSSLKREGIAKTACLEGRNESVVFECHLIKISPKDIAHQYLNYYLNSDLLRHRLISLSITTTMSTISQDAISSLEVIIPSLKEQTAIVQYIESETARIDAKIAKTQRIIELQKEYRTALISEVVTGKIKAPEFPTPEAFA